jgi:hypothetical protein
MKKLKLISYSSDLASGLWKLYRDIKLNWITGSTAARIVLICLVFSLSSYKVPGGEPILSEEMRFQSERALFYFQIRDQPFSEELLKKCLDYEGIKYKDIVILQSQLETGHYTSDIFLNGNNLFGMKYPSRRPTVATGIYKEHAKYAHWSDSVVDYAMWQEYYLSRGYRLEWEIDNDFYLIVLKSIPYAEDSRYVPKLVEMAQRDLT